MSNTGVKSVEKKKQEKVKCLGRFAGGTKKMS